MKRILLLVCLLWGAASLSHAAPRDSRTRQAVQEAMQAIDAAEYTAIRTQSLEALNAAACDEVIRELGLRGKKREEFAALYTAYRGELAATLDAAAGDAALDESGQRTALKAKLDNIAAAARIKRDYVDRFAAILTAEQIRQLYNTEGTIGTRIKRSAAARRKVESRVKGSGNMVSQSMGVAGDYTALEVSNDVQVTVSPTAQQVIVTADDNVIDWVSVTRRGGTLAITFRPEAREISDVSLTAVVPASQTLERITARGDGSIVFQTTLKAPSLTIDAESSGSIEADIETDRLSLNASSDGKFRGAVRAAECTARIHSGATVNGTIRCSKDCTADLQSYGQFKGNAEAASLTIEASSGSTWNGTVHADKLELTAISYGKIEGPIEGGSCTLAASSGGGISGTFTGADFTASAMSYGKINLRGKTSVQYGTVTVQSGGSFTAPDLQVGTYRVTAASYGNAEIRCTGKLSTDISSGGKVSYAGECTIETRNSNLLHRR